MSEIAQAFVRIRPDTRGFTSEAETGVRSAFRRLATVAAGAFAIHETIKFGEDIIRHAGDVQKQIEAIKGEFGAASEAVLKFNDDGAQALGISAHLADTTSARFGILFKNLGIGGAAAAKMTIGFEQLAGSLASIRGLDPSVVLKNLPLAVAGNLRSLKQLGIATDASQLKLAAFKLGLTSTITQGLTPAQRAIAIYSIATAHLSEFQQQAAAHSGDLVNRMRVLSAAWDNARDRLGSGLLPVTTRLVVLLANVLPGALRIAGRVFRDLGQDIAGISSVVAPVVRPIIAMVGNIAKAFQTGGIRGAIDRLVSDFSRLSPAAKIVAVAIYLLTAAFVAFFVSAAPITSITLIVLGLGVAFREAVNHSASFRETLGRIGDIIHGTVIPAVRSVARAVRPTFEGMAADAKRAAEAIRDGLGRAFDFLAQHRRAVEIVGGAVAGAAAAFVTLRIVTAAYAAVARVAAIATFLLDSAFAANPVVLVVLAIGALIGALVILYTRSATARRIMNTIFDGLTSATRSAIKTIREVAQVLNHMFGPEIRATVRNTWEAIVGTVRAQIRIVRGIIEVFTGILHGDWHKAWAGLKDIVGGTFDQIKTIVKLEVGNIEALFSGMWKAIQLLFLVGVEKLVAILAKIPSVHIHIPGFGTIGFENPFKGADEALKASIERFKGTAKRAASEIPNTVSEAAALANAKAAKTLHSSANQAIADAAKSTADVIGRGADSAEAGKAAERAAAVTADAVKTLTGKLQQTVAVQDAAIAKTRAKLKSLGAQIADAITQEAQDVRDAVQQAESNLNSISQSLASSIGSLLDKPLQDAQNRLTAAANKQSLEDLRQQILLPGGKQLSTNPTQALAQLQALAKGAGNINRSSIQAFITQYRSALLSVQQDQVNVIKEGSSRRISDLTDSFNRGQISLTTFKKRILAELTRDHVSYRQAGSLLGTAFANGFRDQVKGLFAQATAIAATPARARVGITGTDISIVRPLDTLRKDQGQIAKLTHQKMDTQTVLQKRIAAAAEKSAKLQAQLAGVKINPDVAVANPGTAGKKARTYNKTTG